MAHAFLRLDLKFLRSPSNLQKILGGLKDATYPLSRGAVAHEMAHSATRSSSTTSSCEKRVDMHVKGLLKVFGRPFRPFGLSGLSTAFQVHFTGLSKIFRKT